MLEIRHEYQDSSGLKTGKTLSDTQDTETLSSNINQQHVNIVLPTTVNLNTEKNAFGCLSMILFIYPIVCCLQIIA